jgi:hypothetical protein
LAAALRASGNEAEADKEMQKAQELQ